MSTNLEVQRKDITAQVLAKVEAFQSSGEIVIPKDYIPANALKSAYIILSETKNKDGKSALEFCTKESVAQSLLKMVVMGLSPLKKQCDFIMYGNRLECGIEYTGNIVLAKRYGGLKNINASAIFKGDEFDFEIDVKTGRKVINKHKQTLDSLGSKEVIGAYAVMEFIDGSFDCEIMSINQIKDSWNQGSMKGNSPAHRNFPDQMSIKTVINRACKLLIRGSNDNFMIESEEEIKQTFVEAEVAQEIEVNANIEEIDFESIENETVENTTDEPQF